MYSKSKIHSLNSCIREYLVKSLKIADRDDELGRQVELDNSKHKHKRKTKLVVDFDHAWEMFTTNSIDLSTGGGEWVHTKNFYYYLHRQCEHYGLQLIFFFNGTIPKCFDTFEWCNRFKLADKQVKYNFQNANFFGKVEPPFLSEYIQLLIHSMNKRFMNKTIFAFQTIENHQKEIIAFCKINKCDGIITDDFDLISMCMLDTSVEIDLYWAKSFKFHSHSLSACLIDKSKVLKALNMELEHFKWFAFLLSSQTSQAISGEWLIEFYKRLTHESIDLKNMTETGYLFLIGELDKYVHRFKSGVIARAHAFKCIFNRVIDENEERDFVAYVDSYMNTPLMSVNFKQEWRFNANNANSTSKKLKSHAIGSLASLQTNSIALDVHSTKKSSHLKETSTPRLSCYNLNLSFNNFIIQDIKPTSKFQIVDDYLEYKSQLNSTLINASINKIDTLSLIEEDDQIYMEELNLTDSFKDKHVNFTMHKWVYHAYFKKKIVLPVYLEPDNEHVVVKCSEIYRPIRLYCYQLLFSGMKPCFDLDDFKKENDLACSVSAHELDPNKKSDTILIEEIIYEPKLQLMKTMPFNVEPITQEFNIQKLWNKSHRERLEQFLFNLNSKYLIDMFFDEKERFIIKNHIDESFIIPCLVVRFLVLKHYTLLTSKDIDAFITTFIWVNKNFHNSSDKERQYHTKNRDPRCAHLAALFLAGIENLYFANDVCGRPLSEDCFYAYRYFSGMFFQLAYENYLLNNTNFLKELNKNNQVNLIKDKQMFAKLHTFILKDLHDKVIDQPYYEAYQTDRFRISRLNTSRHQKNKLNREKKETNSKVRSIGRGLLGIQMINSKMNKIESENGEESDENDFNDAEIDSKPLEKEKPLAKREPTKCRLSTKCTVFVDKDVIDQVVDEKRREQEEKNRAVIEKRFGRLTRLGEKCMGGFNLPDRCIEIIPKIDFTHQELKPKKEGPNWIPITEMPMLIHGQPY